MRPSDQISKIKIAVSVTIEPADRGSDESAGPATPQKKHKQTTYSRRNAEERGIGQVNLIVPLDMRSLFQSIAGRLRKGAPELQECIQKLATSPQNAEKMVLVPEDRAHLVNMVLAADDPGELEVKFSAEPVVSVGQPDASSATVQRLNERIETMGHRIGITALAMGADNDRLIEAARSIEALLETRRPNDRAQRLDEEACDQLTINRGLTPATVAIDGPNEAPIVDPIALQTLRDCAAEFEAFARSRLRPLQRR